VLSDATSIFFTPGTTLKTFDIKDNTVYIGYKDAFKYNTLGSTSAYTSITPPAVTQSYSVYSSSNIFAANYETSAFKIYKFDGSAFNLKTSITGSTGNIYVRHLSADKLVIGISYSADSNGLYILDLTTGSLSKVCSDSITFINVE
jgi:hypothetical protein